MSIRAWDTKRGKRYAARVHVGNRKYKLLQARDTRREAKDDERRFYLSGSAPTRTVAKDFAERFLADYARKRKVSSYDHAAGKIRLWLESFGNRSLESITREESIEWAAENRWAAQSVIAMLNAAKHEGLIERNPMRGESHKTRGRADFEPLTVQDVDRLAAAAESQHGPMMRSFVLFTAYTGLRVGEVFALGWDDIDFKTNRVYVRRRLYKGTLDLPKSNRKREVVLFPEARDALLHLDRSTDWVFTAKKGGQMSQGTLTTYWQKVAAAYGSPVTPHELRHFHGHHLYVTKNIEARDVAAQLGHKNASMVEDLYGHGKVGALGRVESAYKAGTRHLDVLEGGRK